jgi:hypothetical protein
MDKDIVRSAPNCNSQSGDDKNLLKKWLFFLACFDLLREGGELKCLAVILDHYNVKKGYAWPSFETIGQKTSMSARGARYCVESLVAKGILIKRTKGGRGHCNEYVPAWETFQDKQGLTLPPLENKGGRVGALKVEGWVRETGCHSSTHTSYPRSPRVGDKEVSPATPRAAAPDGAARGLPGEESKQAHHAFESFWQAYPRKEGRAKAKRLLVKLIAAGEVRVETLVAKAGQYAMAKAEVEQRYLKLPGNWLAEQCWLEDPQPKPQKALRGAQKTKGKGKAKGKGKDKPTKPAPKQAVAPKQIAAPTVPSRAHKFPDKPWVAEMEAGKRPLVRLASGKKGYADHWDEAGNLVFVAVAKDDKGKDIFAMCDAEDISALSLDPPSPQPQPKKEWTAPKVVEVTDPDEVWRLRMACDAEARAEAVGKSVQLSWGPIGTVVRVTTHDATVSWRDEYKNPRERAVRLADIKMIPNVVQLRAAQ